MSGYRQFVCESVSYLPNSCVLVWHSFVFRRNYRCQCHLTKPTLSWRVLADVYSSCCLSRVTVYNMLHFSLLKTPISFGECKRAHTHEPSENNLANRWVFFFLSFPPPRSTPTTFSFRRVSTREHGFDCRKAENREALHELFLPFWYTHPCSFSVKIRWCWFVFPHNCFESSSDSGSDQGFIISALFLCYCFYSNSSGVKLIHSDMYLGINMRP